MRWIGLLGLVLALAAPAQAGLLTPAFGTLIACAATCTTGCSRDGQTVGVGAPAGAQTNTGSCATTSPVLDFVQPDGASALLIQYIEAGANTFQVEQSIDNGVTWLPVNTECYSSGTACATTILTQSNTTGQFVIKNPLGRYRINVTVAAGTALSFKYRFVRLTNQ